MRARGFSNASRYTYRSYDSTNSGNNNAEELTPTIDDYRRDLRWAVRDFLGINRSTVELI